MKTRASEEKRGKDLATAKGTLHFHHAVSDAALLTGWQCAPGPSCRTRRRPVFVGMPADLAAATDEAVRGRALSARGFTPERCAEGRAVGTGPSRAVATVVTTLHDRLLVDLRCMQEQADFLGNQDHAMA